MDFNVIVGGRLLALTVLIRGIKPIWASEATLRILCQVKQRTVLVTSSTGYEIISPGGRLRPHL